MLYFPANRHEPAPFSGARRHLARPIALAAALAIASCGGGGGSSATPSPTASPTASGSPTPSPSPSPSPSPTTTPVPAAWYRPAAGISWNIQLQGNLDTFYNVALYDIDLFDIPQATFAQLRTRGIRVLCYFSAGTYEPGRPDSGDFPSAVLGNAVQGWPGERWLDIRATSVRDIMKKRMDLARSKGCDGVDPDNVDGYTNNPGFPLTAADQLNFNRFLASEAHARGLAVALKNDLDQVTQLVGDFDMAVNEQCFEYSECDLLKPFIDAGKPVLNIEYRALYRTDATARAALSQNSLARGFSTQVLALDLDNSLRFSCR